MLKSLVTLGPKAGKCMLPPVRDVLALELLHQFLKMELERVFGKMCFPRKSIYFLNFTNVCIICSKYADQYLYKRISLIQ